MNYGMQISASGVMSSLYRMDVLANNLANLNTPGFKPDRVVLRQRDAARVEDRLGWLPSDRLMDRLGAGVTPTANRVSAEQGPLVSTDDPLHVAIRGEGFLVVREHSDNGRESLNLTRDGQLALDSRGRLVHSGTGMAVMDTANRAITLAGTEQVRIDPDGTISQGGAAVARIRLVSVPDPSRMTKLGGGMFRASADELGAMRTASGTLLQGQLESAAVDPIRAINAIAAAARAAESNNGMINYHDRMMDRAINGLGRMA